MTEEITQLEQERRDVERDLHQHEEALIKRIKEEVKKDILKELGEKPKK